MLIKVPVKFLDSKALEKAIHTEIMAQMASMGITDPAERCLLYNKLESHAYALVDLLKERTIAVLNLDCNKENGATATLVRLVK